MYKRQEQHLLDGIADRSTGLFRVDPGAAGGVVYFYQAAQPDDHETGQRPGCGGGADPGRQSGGAH